MFRAGEPGWFVSVFLRIPFREAPRLAPRGLCSVLRSADMDRRPSLSAAGETRPCFWVSAVV